MSNKPAPRCPGCGNEMRLRRYNCDRGAVNAWYACDCGWKSPNGDDENEAYDKAVRRYEPVQRDGYQGTAHEQGWPDQRMQTVFGGGEVRFDSAPGRYPLVCQSTQETEQGCGGQWISVRDRLPEPGQKIIAVFRNSGGLMVDQARYRDDLFDFSGWCNVQMESVTHWMPIPKPPKEGE